MLPISHVVLFVPFIVFATLFITAAAVNALANFTARRRPVKPAPIWTTPARNSQAGAQIIYFSPRKTSVPSGLSLGLR